MQDDPTRPPAALNAIIADTSAASFPFASDSRLGAVLRMLAATKPGGRLLEIGTGTGIGAAWMLDGMCKESHLTSIEANGRWAAIAAKHLRHDARLTLLEADAFSWFGGQPDESYDLVFADAMPGKYDGFEALWRLIRHGGIYVIGRLQEEANWPAGHAETVAALLDRLEARSDVRMARLAWSSGLAIAAKV